jgi:uncharacterized membrane protein YfcA
MELAWSSILALALVGAGAGCLGAMVGVGGGVLLVPALSIGFGVDLKIAIATSLVAVLATSTAAGSVYVGRGLANMRLGMTLETTTTLGGILGGIVAVHVSHRFLASLFGAMMLLTSVLMLRAKRDTKREAPKAEAQPAAPPPAQNADEAGEPPGGYEDDHGLSGGYYDDHARRMVHYDVVRLPFGMVVALVAGAVSGMLGVGGGFLKVPAMNLVMRVPLRVAAATSNVMIGVTAIASLFVYFARGYVHPPLAAPVALGVVVGSFVGTVLASKAPPMALRFVLAAVLVFVALQMIFRAVTGVGLG